MERETESSGCHEEEDARRSRDRLLFLRVPSEHGKSCRLLIIMSFLCKRQ